MILKVNPVYPVRPIYFVIPVNPVYRLFTFHCLLFTVQNYSLLNFMAIFI